MLTLFLYNRLHLSSKAATIITYVIQQTFMGPYYARGKVPPVIRDMSYGEFKVNLFNIIVFLQVLSFLLHYVINII